MNIDDLPIIEGFDAVKESRLWKQDVNREMRGMTSEERVASYKELREWYAKEQKASRNRERELLSA